MKVVYTGNPQVLEHGELLWANQVEHSKGALVRFLIAELPPSHRAAVQMRYYGRLTYQQIADSLGWPSRGYAWMYCRRGMDKLKARLEELYPEWKEDEQ